MDCIDHSTNTTAYLRLIERHGWLKFHGVGERVVRGRMLSDALGGAQSSSAARRTSGSSTPGFSIPGCPPPSSRSMRGSTAPSRAG